jgi:aminoglycoside 2''-phosphotransferase
VDARQALRQVRATFPSLHVTRLRRLGEGWANVCWLADGDVVFRFAKTGTAMAALRKEASLMPALAAALPLGAPDFRYAAPDAGLAGYPLVSGEPLPALAQAHAAQVADFLTALHGFSTNRAAALGAPGGGPEVWRAELAAFAEDTQALLVPHWTADDADRARAHIAAFLEDEKNFAFTPALIHRDLVPEHLLADPGTGRLTGVIDFEDASLGDPAFDFTGLGDVAPTVLAAYRGPADPGFLRRAAFYQSLRPLHAMRHGAGTGRRSHVRAGLAAWRRLFR